jgi:ribonuclease G
MKSELIVDVKADEVSFALLEDSRLVSLQKESRNLAYAVGDIYLAKVKKMMPGLNAAFVNVGYEKDAFLHYLDLGPHFASYSEFMRQLLEGSDKRVVPSVSKLKPLPDIDKHGSITDTLTPGRELMVQIVKEPISSKGPRLTTEIAFTGRFMVLQPFCDKVSVSQKIKSSEEKLRLRRIIESIKPRNFGVIIRTSAEGKGSAELHHELRTLIQCWEETVGKAREASCPALIFEEESRVVGMLRDIFNPSFENIYVNNRETFAQISKYVTLIAPDKKEIVKFYDKKEPIFDHFNITRQIKSSFGKTVSFKNGAYIIIEHTEALHVIDVNSGNRTKAGSDQETNALEVNLRAGEEIARQLRLRDMGGIIVVDFIDMAKSEHRQQLFDHMRELMAKDRARHNILPLSKFGLMQITRQRVRPALDITTTETCPSCFGKGEVRPSILFTDTLAEKIEFLVRNLEQRNFIMYVHPYVDAYIKKGIFSSIYGSWRRKFGRCFKIMPDQSLAYLQYRVIDKDGNELQLHSEKDSNSSSVSKTLEKAKKRGGDDEETESTAKPRKGQRLIDQPRELLPSKPKKDAEASKQQPKADKQPKAAKPQPAPKAREAQKPQAKKADKTKPETSEAAPESPATTSAANQATTKPAAPKAQAETTPPATETAVIAAKAPDSKTEAATPAKAPRPKPRAKAEKQASASKPATAEKTASTAEAVALPDAPSASADNEPAAPAPVAATRKPRQRPARKPRAASTQSAAENKAADTTTARPPRTETPETPAPKSSNSEE